MNRTSYLVLAAMAGVMLLFAISVSYLDHRFKPREQERIAIGAPLSEQQTLSRRRAAIATAAIAGTTAQ